MFRTNSDTASLWQLVKKIKNIEEPDVELVVSENCPLLENLLAFKLLVTEAASLGKTLLFKFEDKNFAFLSAALNPPQEVPQEKEEKPSVPAAPTYKMSAPEILPEKNSGKTALKLPKFSFNFKPKMSLGLPLGILVLFLILAGLAASYAYYIPKSLVSLTVDSEPLVRAIDVTASATASAGVGNAVVIPALEISTTSKRSESTSSSGKKDVGDKATGTVTIYNKTQASANLPASTFIIHGRVVGDDLRFLTKTAVTVPARTPNPLTVSGYDPGTASVDIAAENFGEEYNLASGDTFPVGSRSTNDFIAQNSGNFTGGTKRQAVVVTASDQKNLLDVLTVSLKDELKSTLLAKLVSGQNIDENSVSYKVTSKSFDHGVGEEASQLGLTLEMDASVMAFSQDELKNAVYGKLLTFVPDGYQLYGREQDVEVIEAKASGKVLKISARGKGFIVPKVDTEDVKRKILGKDTKYAESYLGSLSNISSYKIETPMKFGPFSLLPYRPQNLNVEVARR